MYDAKRTGLIGPALDVGSRYVKNLED